MRQTECLVARSYRHFEDARADTRLAAELHVSSGVHVTKVRQWLGASTDLALGKTDIDSS